VPTSEDLSGLWIDGSTNNVWAVGAKGTVLVMHEGQWSQVAPPSPDDLFSVVGVGGDIWVSGGGGTFRREGDHWLRDGDARLLSMQTTPDGAIWGTSVAGFFSRKNGHWELTGRPPRDEMPFGGSLGTAGDAWAVGGRGNIFYRGPSSSSWEVSAPSPAWWSEADPNASVSGIYAAGGRVWAIGFNLGILAWDGTTWQHDPSVHRMNAIAGTGASNVWVVGEGALHWDGRAWQRYEDGLDATLWSLAVFSPTDVWAGGGRGYVAHFDGRSWNGTVLPARDIVSVWGTSSHDVWVIDFSGRTFHGDGVSWTEETLAPLGAEPPVAMWGSSANDIWMATKTGTLHKTREGVSGTTLVGEDALVSTVTGAGPNDVFIGGLHRNNATLHHWDGKAWKEMSSHPQGQISALFIDEDGTLWVGTENGCIYEKAREK
jgi:hypothetical protein